MDAEREQNQIRELVAKGIDKKLIFLSLKLKNRKKPPP